MSRSRVPLSPRVEHQVASYARAGGFPEVAAEAAGMALDAFREWIRRGEAPRAAAAPRRFAAAVRQAHAQARLTAEIAVLGKRPLDWLRYGPGRDGPRQAGWGAAVRPRIAEDEVELTLESPQLTQFVQDMMKACEPWPEVRAGLAALLWEK